MNLIGIITLKEDFEMPHDTGEPEPSQQDLSIQHKAFQICKDQIEASNFNILTDSHENSFESQMDNNINEEEFYDSEDFKYEDLNPTWSFQ